eukprot:scaffold52215_cov15-Tisochrysis_lutea.AAC.1
MASISSCMTLGGRHHWEGLRSKAYASPVCAAAQPLSVDHKPNSKEERQRIENAGGVVVWAGTWRVGGVLAVSRAFGDKPLKRYVIATPDIREESLRDDDEFLILASDGLWDVISNQVQKAQQTCCMQSHQSLAGHSFVEHSKMRKPNRMCRQQGRLAACR